MSPAIGPPLAIYTVEVYMPIINNDKHHVMLAQMQMTVTMLLIMSA